MDTDITNSLDQLEKRKQHINNQTDLQDECNSLIDLDNRVSTLLSEIQTLHVDVEQRYDFIENNLAQLSPSNKALQRAATSLDLVTELSKLNRICRRIETSPNIDKSPDNSCLSIKLFGNDDNPNDDQVESNDRIVHYFVRQMIDDFEQHYRPLESILSKRQDLPYHSYATKVRNLKASMAKSQSNM